MPAATIPPPAVRPPSPPRTNAARGLLPAAASYLLWGAFPLYFDLLADAGAVEIVAHRIAWSFVFCLVGVTLARQWPAVRVALRHRRLVGSLALAGVLVSLNWLTYVYAVVTGHVVDAALGYFINPLITVTLALVFLHERLRRAQTIALAVGVVAVVVLVIGYGQFPWIGVVVAVTFGLYSLAKNRVGGSVTPLVGLGFESATLTPLAVVYVAVLQAAGQGHFTTHGTAYTLLLIGTGIVTAVPLLFFAIGAARLPLATLAFLQYIAPVLQFLVGVGINHEHMPPARWAGFALIWVALVILSADGVRTVRKAQEAMASHR